MGLKVERLVTFCPQDPESKLFHVPNIKWTTLQAKSAEIPQDLVEAPMNQEHDVLLKTLTALRKQHEVEGVVAGVIASNYQRRILQEICEKAGLKLITPLWGRDPFNVVNQMINEVLKGEGIAPVLS
jgi:uncharacterized protein (TIGR00290 family)